MESPVSHLLASNEVPTDQEKEATRQFIETLHNRRCELDQEIDILLRKRREESAAIDEVIHRHKAVTNPVRALPPELLSEIFHQCQRGTTLEILPEVPDSFHPVEGPMSLTHVCHQWRMIAVSSPGLWTTLRLEVGFPPRSQSQSQSQLALVLLWISRSGIAPLTIGLNINDRVETLELHQSPIFLALLRSSNKWKFFFLSTVLPHDVFAVLEPYTKTLSAMKEYTFITPEIIHKGHRRAKAPYRVHLSPGLIDWPRSMDTIRLQVGFNYEGFSLPLHQLTTLEIYSELDLAFITIKQFFTILKQGPNLRDLRVRCLGIELEFPDPDNLDMENLIEHTHPRLETLHLTVVNDGYSINPLLQHATFPSLKRLTIGSVTRKRPWSHAALARFLDRTSGGIQELEVVGRELGWSEVAQYFLRTPNASRVSIKATGLGDYKLNTTSDVLRRLEHLSLEGEVHISSGAFAEFLRRRCGAHVEFEEMEHLRTLDIRCLGDTTEFVNADVFEKLTEYSETGTKIQIETDYACLFPRASFLPRRFH